MYQRPHVFRRRNLPFPPHGSIFFYLESHELIDYAVIFLRHGWLLMKMISVDYYTMERGLLTMPLTGRGQLSALVHPAAPCTMGNASIVDCRGIATEAYFHFYYRLLC